MKISASIKKLVLASSLAIMFVSLTTVAIAAQANKTPVGTRGGVRGGGSPVQVVVKMNGAPVAGATVTFTSKASVTKTTDSSGVVTIDLVPGHYKVSASSDAGSGSKTITVKESTTTLIVGITLAPK